MRVVVGQLMPSVSTLAAAATESPPGACGPRSPQSSSARASLTCNTHARARMHARHCTSDMKQIRFTPQRAGHQSARPRVEGGLPVSTSAGAAVGASESDPRASHPADGVESISFSGVELQN